MDFLKSCTTNVHAIETLSHIQYQRYDHLDQTLSDAARWTQTHNTLTALRQQGVLCCCSDDHLWIFGDPQRAQEQIGEQFHPVEHGVLENTQNKPFQREAMMESLLLDATEHAIAFGLNTELCVKQIAPWTWVFRRLDEAAAVLQSYVIRLHARFGFTGPLYLVPEIFPTSLSDVNAAIKPGLEVIIAPTGKMAKTEQSDTEDVIHGEAWMTFVTQALWSKGIQLEEHVEWYPIRPLQGQVTAFIWPGTLLLALDGTSEDEFDCIARIPDWQCWFAGPKDVDTFRNPLELAEEWFIGSGDREREAQAANMNRAQAEEFASQVTTTPIIAAVDVDMTSPPFTQRSADQLAAMAGIYPTPPDGLTQGQQAPQLMPVSTPSVAHGDHANSVTDALPTSDDSYLKSQDFLSGLGGTAGYQMDQDELFGDEGDIEFGVNAVDDADFNFFDEPDNDPSPVPDADDDTMAHEATHLEVSMHPETLEHEAALQAAEKEASEAIQEVLEATEGTQGHFLSPQVGALLEPDDSNRVEDMVPPRFGGSPTPLDKPLSPFGIKERLLPPPVPASIAHNASKEALEQRPNSTFSPIVFRENVNLGSKYVAPDLAQSSHTNTHRLGMPDISLPATRKKFRTSKHTTNEDRDNPSNDSESGEDSFESSSSDADEGLPPQLPWDNRKRKRNEISSISRANSFDAWPNSDSQIEIVGHTSEHMINVLRQQLYQEHWKGMLTNSFRLLANVKSASLQENADMRLPTMAVIFDLCREDLVYVAQLIGEQAVTATDDVKHSIFDPVALRERATAAVTLTCEKITSKAVQTVFPECDAYDLGKIALTRDSHPQLRSVSTPSKGPQTQSRPLQRSDSFIVGPDIFLLQPPYVKVQRGTDSWEMLSTCLSFWETLGLGPANGAKNVRAFCMFPSLWGLQQSVELFMAALGTAYDNCRFGSHAYLRSFADLDEEPDSYEDGMAPVELGDDRSLDGAMKAYAITCVALGKVLSNISLHEMDRTIVIYMLNPFAGNQARQYLCACFWMLFKAYRDNLPKAHHSQSRSDVVLQILPINVVADLDMVTIPDAKYLATLAREVYDRCPPSSTMQTGDASTLPIMASPSVELAGAAPKRIGFQLAANPPSNLLHEGSILHVAYACTQDRQWLVAAWLDNTGQHYSTASFSLRGTSLADGIQNVWERTREIIAARQVTWRVFVVTSDGVDSSLTQCWRSSCSSTPRQQPLCVTMLSINPDPALHISPPPLTGDASALGGARDQVLTPASTPQASNFTSSPDVSGYNANAPPTPAPSEIAASLVETDPDAHLIDITDERWGIMLSPKFTNLASNTGLANAALLRRDTADTASLTGDALVSIGISLHWTIQVKSNGTVDEGSVKQAELTLREVLKMYRNLSLLTKARGLDVGRMSMMPLHVAAVMRAAKWLNRMLPAS